MKLKDPEECPHCHAVLKFRVIASRRRVGYRRKVLACRECGTTWEAFFTLIHPRRAWEDMPDDQRRHYSTP